MAHGGFLRMSENLSFGPACAYLLVVAVLFVVGPVAVFAQSSDEDLEREAQAIDKMVMCPVCPAETIDQAQVEISFQMRAVIREMLAEGRSREEILDYFVDRYGADILAAPPKSGVNLLAWILPVAGVLAGLAVLFLIVRSMVGQNRLPSPARVGADWRRATRTTPESPRGSPVDVELSPYLEIVDRNLALRRGGRSAMEDRGNPNSSPEEGAASPSELGGDG